MMKYFLPFFLFLASFAHAQPGFWKPSRFTLADTLRGALSEYRSCYDVRTYDLYVDVNIQNKSIAGRNTFGFEAMSKFSTLQIDLFENLTIDSIVYGKTALKFNRKANAVFVEFPEPVAKGAKNAFAVYYHGVPTAAINPPWDGGLIWRTDENGRPWVTVACQGIGASIWWPCKDHLSDEPDNGMTITVKVHEPGLTAICNGKEQGVKTLPDGSREFSWGVHYPINSYNVTMNIGDYAHFYEIFKSKEDGANMDMDYYVLSYNLEKAKAHFKQADAMLHSFEKHYGKYPFANDGYALVETPYAGMEHQSAVAYGNGFEAGYGGFVREGLPFDFIILHESGHEWFGNSLSCSDLAEMWIHEGFCTYSESTYIEDLHGYAKAMAYINDIKDQIDNSEPMLGPFGVNFDDHSVDIYYKGALMLNTLRHVINDDKKWWDILKTFCTRFKYQFVTGSDFTKLVKEKTGTDYTNFFKQYLEYAQPPVLEYQLAQNGKNLLLKYRWAKGGLEEFTMPIEVGAPGKMVRVSPTNQWQELSLSCKKVSDFKIDTNKFYIILKKINS